MFFGCCSLKQRWIGCLVAFVVGVSIVGVSFTHRSRAAVQQTRRFQSLARRLKPLHKKKEKPQPGDWLLSHKEKGQTFAQYVRVQPNRATAERNSIYVQPIGDFSKQEQQVLNDTTEFIRLFYGLQVKTLKALPEKTIPENARRVHPTWGDKQLLTSHILYQVLLPQRPPDAVAVLGLTATDLWPGEGWNFVFGQADLRQRVGVWSMYRNGKTDTPANYQVFLRRTLKTAVHELGHMFSIQHCIAYQCCMNGSNSRPESDRQPLKFCPECVQKVWFSCRVDPVKRYEQLYKFCRMRALHPEAAAWKKALEAIR